MSENENGVVEKHNTDPLAVIRFTQGVRYQMVDEATGHGTRMPEKMSELAMVLRDMDGAALKTRELDIEEKSVDSDVAAVRAVRQIRQMFGGKCPLEVEVGAVQVERQRSIIPDGHVIPAVNFRPGETAQGETLLDVADFVVQDV